MPISCAEARSPLGFPLLHGRDRMRNRTIRGCLGVSVLFIACVSAASKDLQRTPPNDQTEIHNAETKEQRPAEPPIVVNVSPPQKTHEEIEQEAKEREERSDLDKKIVELTGDLAKYTFGLFVATAALVLAIAGLGYLGWRQSRNMKDSIAVAKNPPTLQCFKQEPPSIWNCPRSP